MKYLNMLDRLYRKHPFTFGWGLNTLTFLVMVLVMSALDKPHGITVRKAEQPRISTPSSELKWRTK